MPVTQLHVASNIVVGQLKNTIDSYVRKVNPTLEEQRFFGTWIFQHIMDGTINSYVIDGANEYLNEKVHSQNIVYDLDDYYTHMGLAYISMKSYVESVYWFEKVSTAGNVYTILNKWQTTKALQKKAIENYSNQIALPTSLRSDRNFNLVFNGFTSLELDKLSILLVKLQATVKYWDKIDTDSGYTECALALSHACIVYESLIKSYCLRKNPGVQFGPLDSMITGEVNANNPGLASKYSAAIGVANPKTAGDYKRDFLTLIAHIGNSINMLEYIGSVFHLARVTRNNSMHALDVSNKLFANSNDFRSIIDVVLESIMLIRQLK